jgi:capsular exopolysaccharide synthesis family protein
VPDSSRTLSGGNASILDEDRFRLTPADGPEPGEPETLVERTLHLLRARWWVILQALIVIPAAALVLSLTQQEKWTATSTVMFEPARQNGGSVDLTRQAATQSKLVALPAVADATAAKLGRGWTGRAVRDAVEVNGTGDTNLVEVSATTPRGPREAARVATTYAQTFVSLQEAANVADVKRRLKVYDDYVNSLPPEERSGPRGQRLQQALDTLRINEALQSDSQKGTAEVVQPAEVPTSPSSPKTVRNVALAVVVALVIGLALAALVDRLDRAVKTVDELERVYRLPVLARIPRERGFGRRLRQRGAAEALRHGAEAEAFRALRANLRYFGDVRTLLIVSPEAEDGKSTVAACLATTFAQRGDRVVLVEADLHKPGGAERVGGPRAGAAPNDLGLSGVLAGGALDDALVMVPVGNGDDTRELTVLPSGPPPPNPSELLESRRMREVMRELAERYDLALYDTPAMGAVSDAFALVSDNSGVIVVSRLGHTHRDRARELLKQLALLRAHVLGVVANYADLPKDGGYRYYGR